MVDGRTDGRTPTRWVYSGELIRVSMYVHFTERFELQELDLMFMKHYAPNRCLYIKVAKFRTGWDLQRCHTYKSLKLLAVILFEISYLQNCTLTPLKGHNSARGDNSDKKKYG